ncbi:hypothetical protein BH24ACT22_BH24ACT22_05860 [soil metagenome]
MWRLLAGIFVGCCAIAVLNTVLLLYAPLQDFPLQSVVGLWNKVFAGFALLLWGVAAFGASVLACRVAGRLEGVVSIGSVVLGTAMLIGFPFAFLDNIPAAYLQLGSVIMSLPLLFVFYVGGLVAFFGRRPDMV